MAVLYLLRRDEQLLDNRVYYGYGGSMYQQVSNAGTEYKHWNLRSDLVEASSFVQIVNIGTIYGGE
jgi:hypothetical protein